MENTYYCRDVLAHKCLANSLGVYCYSRVFTALLPSIGCLLLSRIFFTRYRATGSVYPEYYFGGMCLSIRCLAVGRYGTILRQVYLHFNLLCLPANLGPCVQCFFFSIVSRRNVSCKYWVYMQRCWTHDLLMLLFCTQFINDHSAWISDLSLWLSSIRYRFIVYDVNVNACIGSVERFV
jgi:hypothetical protein